MGAYVINLDECANIRTHWVAISVKNDLATYFDSFGVEHIPKEIKKFISNNIINTNVYRIQAYDSIMCGYFCIGFTLSVLIFPYIYFRELKKIKICEYLFLQMSSF